MRNVLKTKHFGVTEWADFVRGFLNRARRHSMKLHLASGCARCHRTVSLFESVLEVTGREAEYEAPAFAVRCARAIYSLQPLERVHILPRVLARLVFDSFRQPQLAGVRAQQRVSRQALYEAGDFCVDLRLESESEGARVSLVGQIANRKDPEMRIANVPVLLLSGRQVAGHAVSNEFGEFQMTYRPSRHLRLYVPVQEESGIEVAIGQIDASPPPAKAAAKSPRRRKRKS